jgi:trimeric autotransporter adhesin
VKFRPLVEGLEQRVVPSSVTVTNTNDNGAGSLRAAIGQVNLGVANAINFNIPGNGVHTIIPHSGLPEIQKPVTIDGYTQPGAHVNTLATGDNAVLLIQLIGSLAGSANGLVIDGGSSTIRGLVIGDFSGEGIILQTKGGDSVAGNFIGTNPFGNAVRTNHSGVVVSSGTNFVGGPTPDARNVIVGMTGGYGVFVSGPSAHNNKIQGNSIGTNAAETALLGTFGDDVNINGGATGNFVGTDSTGVNDATKGNVLCGATFNGVSIYSPHTDFNVVAGNFIGTNEAGAAGLGNHDNGVAFGYTTSSGGPQVNRIGTKSGGASPSTERNVISGNGTGIFVGFVGATGLSNNLIAGNYIGTTPSGTEALPNNGDGIFFAGASGNKTSTNVIAFNNGDGVGIDGGKGDSILSNSIYSNTGLGIDLLNGGNHTIATPALTSAVLTTNGTTIHGTLIGPANATLTIQFFSNLVPQPPLTTQGMTFIGSLSVVIGSNRSVSFTANLPAKVKIGELITATATNSQNDTSKFSAAVAVQSSDAIRHSSAKPAVDRNFVMALDAVFSGGLAAIDLGFFTEVTAVRRNRWFAWSNPFVARLYTSE